jgi:hypothetical protein
MIRSATLESKVKFDLWNILKVICLAFSICIGFLYGLHWQADNKQREIDSRVVILETQLPNMNSKLDKIIINIDTLDNKLDQHSLQSKGFKK